MKKLLLVIFGLFVLSQGHSQIVSPCQTSKNQSLRYCSELNPTMMRSSLRSDSIDIKQYTINLEITNFTTRIIEGNCEISFKSRLNNVNYIRLDLLNFTVDSVKLGNQICTFNYQSPSLKINFPSALNQNDSNTVTVFYKGIPATDPTWGGFYFQSGYAYNMGVGFQVDPHNFGRAWFPCFDNFVERSKFAFNIITTADKNAWCNGNLIGRTNLPNNKVLNQFKLEEEIPTYLASVAISNYVVVNRNHAGLNGNIPVRLVSLAADTNNMKASMINLPQAIEAFEDNYGSHPFSSIGFVVVPFTGGAMEHATNIAYPRFGIDGSLNYETLYAHELAHHWWGDNVTCETAGDMWLNEGWASFSEHLFTEKVYGKKASITAIKNRLADVVHYTHHKEGGFRAVSGVPHNYTYGSHVYDKGALVANSLRGYMGDSLFFGSIKTFMNQNKFSDISSAKLRDGLSQISGINLTNFFNDWVFNPGFPEFSIDSITELPTGAPRYKIAVKQRKHGAPNLFSQVPLKVTLFANDWSTREEEITMNGETAEFSFMDPFQVAFVAINRNYEISQSVIADEFVLKQIGAVSGTKALVSLNVSAIQDSAFIRIEHHYAPADDFKFPNANFKVSKNHFWVVNGLDLQKAKIKANINYDGRPSGSNGTGYLDMDLGLNNEDSVYLLYRKNAGQDWQIFPNYIQNQLGNSPKFGRFEIDSLIAGEYTIGYGEKLVLSAPKKKEKDNKKLKIFPNPSKKEINFNWDGNPNENYTIQIFDLKGSLVHQTSVRSNVLLWNHNLENGFYEVKVKNNEQFILSDKFIVRN